MILAIAIMRISPSFGMRFCVIEIVIKDMLAQFPSRYFRKEMNTESSFYNSDKVIFLHDFTL